jgi:hypothetical protein
MLKVAWASTKENKPKSIFISEKNESNEIPKTISGITTGTYNTLSITLLPLKLYLYIPTAAIVPIIPETKVLKKATIIVFFKASRSGPFENNSPYHFKVNPSKLMFSFELLKENNTNTKIGRYKNK